jgi:hypothetical protein
MKTAKRSFALGFAIIVMLSLVLVSGVAASGTDLNLPSNPVIIIVVNGTQSYFETELMNVPSGYDVVNGKYFGWCVDTRAEMLRNTSIPVYLYSSLNPPGELANEEWDMVNYILNHREGYDLMDVQEAIWYFIHMDASYTPRRQGALQIVNDALANGNGFFPAIGEKVAVICYPTTWLPGEEVQVSIIEINNTVIAEFPSVHLMLLIIMSGTLFAVIIFKRKKQNLKFKAMRNL